MSFEKAKALEQEIQKLKDVTEAEKKQEIEQELEPEIEQELELEIEQELEPEIESEFEPEIEQELEPKIEQEKETGEQIDECVKSDAEARKMFTASLKKAILGFAYLSDRWRNTVSAAAT